MNDFNFIQWISIVGPIAGLVWTIRNENMAVRDENFRLWKENQERWITTQLEIKEILKRIDGKSSKMP